MNKTAVLNLLIYQSELLCIAYASLLLEGSRSFEMLLRCLSRAGHISIGLNAVRVWDNARVDVPDRMHM